MGGVTTYAYDNDDELTGTSGGFTNSFGYNANGDKTTRTLAGTSYSLTYDYDDQLTSTGGASFAYDAAGRRVSRTAGGVTTNFLYDGGSVLLEKQGSATTATYTYGNALIRKDGETPLFDGLGSERTVTNSGQAVTASLTLSAFGQTVASTGSSTSAYGFGATSGYRNEGDAGLTLVGCRFYDAQVGRFISRDTDLSQKAYVYCEVDPVNGLDPSGHNVIFSAGFGGSFSFFTQRFTYSFGAAFDLNNGDFELTSTPGHYHGVGLGADVGPYLGLGSGTLSGFNGASSGYNASLGEGAVGGVAYDYNAGYKGIAISAGLGIEAGAFMGIPGSGSSTRGGSYTFNPGGIHNFNN